LVRQRRIGREFSQVVFLATQKRCRAWSQADFYEYRENLNENIDNLVKRLKQKNYQDRLVRRQYILKINGKLRPLGIPATDDKVLQFAVAEILEAIYEEDFLDVNYGCRPGTGLQDAMRDLTRNLQFGRFSHIVF
jgi:retron-type reverse transcriptase